MVVARLEDLGGMFDLSYAVPGKEYVIELTTGHLYVTVITGGRGNSAGRFTGLTVTAITTRPSSTYARRVITVGSKWSINGKDTMGVVKTISMFVP